MVWKANKSNAIHKTNSLSCELLIKKFKHFLLTMNFTAEAAKAALSDVLTALESPENIQKLSTAKENSGNEMLKTMQFVFPTVMQIQMEVIKKYGFPDGREGAVQFAQLIRSLEKEDKEVAKLHTQVRSYFLPNAPINLSTDASL